MRGNSCKNELMLAIHSKIVPRHTRTRKSFPMPQHNELKLSTRYISVCYHSKRLNRNVAQRILPSTSTTEQYLHFWGSVGDCFRRACMSLAGTVLTSSVNPLICSLVATSFLWIPLVQASMNNYIYNLPYAKICSGKIVCVSDGKVDNSEVFPPWSRTDTWVDNSLQWLKIRVAVGDEAIEMDLPARITGKNSIHEIEYPGVTYTPQNIAGYSVKVLVTSDCMYFTRFKVVPEIFIPILNIWMGEYPHVHKAAFFELKDMFDT